MVSLCNYTGLKRGKLNHVISRFELNSWKVCRAAALVYMELLYVTRSIYNSWSKVEFFVHMIDLF